MPIPCGTIIKNREGDMDHYYLKFFIIIISRYNSGCVLAYGVPEFTIFHQSTIERKVNFAEVRSDVVFPPLSGWISISQAFDCQAVVRGLAILDGVLWFLGWCHCRCTVLRWFLHRGEGHKYFFPLALIIRHVSPHTLILVW